MFSVSVSFSTVEQLLSQRGGISLRDYSEYLILIFYLVHENYANVKLSPEVSMEKFTTCTYMFQGWLCIMQILGNNGFLKLTYYRLVTWSICINKIKTLPNRHSQIYMVDAINSQPVDCLLQIQEYSNTFLFFQFVPLPYEFQQIETAVISG